MRIQPTDAAQIVATGALRPSRIPIRKPAAATTDNGPLAPELAAGIARVKSAKSNRRAHGQLAAAQTGASGS